MEEQLIKRIMPHSVSAEQSVIGSMLLDREAIASAAEIISADDFYNQQYAAMFETIYELYNEGKPADPVTLQDRLREKDVPPEVGTVEFINDCISMVPTSLNVKEYATIVYEKSVLRKLIRVSEDISNTCYLGKEKLEAILGKTEKDVFNLLQTRNSGEFTPIADVVANVIDNMDRASRSTSSVTGLATGFTELDNKTSGLQKSDLILIAARPSMGKTAFVLNLAHHIAVKNKHTVAIFSLEMNKEQLVNRVLSMHSGVESTKLRNGDLTSNEWADVIQGAGDISESSIIIDDTSGISINELRSKCRKLKLERNLELIMIDYLQLMSGSGKSDSRQQEISEISRSLKSLARELNVPVIALSQLSRAVEARTDHRPILSDLRESGAIEQDADIVMLLYRDDYYNKDTDKKNVAEVIIAKQRNGPIGTVELAWIPDKTKFANLEPAGRHNNQN
ncbi:MAG: replicative DNA helicase [Lachnospiraceae bacterium]|nr:replicative DNA helicase [Lachnospiraceae bacterium]